MKTITLADFVFDAENEDDSKVKQMFDFIEEHLNDQYGEFHLVEPKFATRPDLHAFIILDKLAPSIPTEHERGSGEKYLMYSDIIACAEHDEVYLDFHDEDLNDKITIEMALDLYRCGIIYDEDNGGFKMNA